MNLDSREYQCQLRPALFADAASATASLLDFIASLDRDVRLSTSEPRRIHFAQILYDTPAGAFKAPGLVLRLRRFPNGDACTFKATARDRYDVEGAPVESPDRESAKRLLWTRVADLDLPECGVQTGPGGPRREPMPVAKSPCYDGSGRPAVLSDLHRRRTTASRSGSHPRTGGGARMIEGYSQATGDPTV